MWLISRFRNSSKSFCKSFIVWSFNPYIKSALMFWKPTSLASLITLFICSLLCFLFNIFKILGLNDWTPKLRRFTSFLYRNDSLSLVVFSMLHSKVNSISLFNLNILIMENNFSNSLRVRELGVPPPI